MVTIKDREQYKLVCERVEELLAVVDNETPVNDKSYVELELLSNLVSEYEEVYLTVNPPTLPEILRLRMAEMGRKLAIDPHILLGV